MKVKDHFLSHEIFEVKPSKYEGILKTVPQPSSIELPRYYDSDSYISHQTKPKSVKDFVYQKIKSLMLSRKKNWIFNYKTSGSILDIGAGTGDFLNQFNSKDWHKNAIEPSKKLHTILKEKDIKLYGDLDEVKKDSQDIITMWHSLEHIPDLEYTLRSISSLLKSDGILCIAVPNYKSYDAYFYKSNWAAWDVPRHLWHFSRTGIKTILDKYSFKCIDEKALIFDAYYVSLLSEKYHPKGNMIRSIYNGCLSNLKARRNKEYSSILYVFKTT